MEKEMEGKFYAFGGDISLPETNEAMIDYAIEKFGKIDILVNNAGIVDQGATVEHISDEMWERTMKVNLYGPMYAIRYFVKKKLELGEEGSIVSTSSVGGHAYPHICGCAYASSKAALLQLTRHVAYSYAKKGIRCNAICVGACPSTGMPAAFTNPDMEGMALAAVINGFNVRNAEPVELGEAILFLASDNASYVNGVALDVDGGWSAL